MIKNLKTYGQVFLYEPDYQNKTIKEIGRSLVMNYIDALDLYSNTPNPASQMMGFNDRAERLEQEELLSKLIQNREWLDQLFECI